MRSSWSTEIWTRVTSRADATGSKGCRTRLTNWKDLGSGPQRAWAKDLGRAGGIAARASLPHGRPHTCTCGRPTPPGDPRRRWGSALATGSRTDGLRVASKRFASAERPALAPVDGLSLPALLGGGCDTPRLPDPGRVVCGWRRSGSPPLNGPALAPVDGQPLPALLGGGGVAPRLPGPGRRPAADAEVARFRQTAGTCASGWPIPCGALRRR